jgi:taurine transport system permease protein
MLFFPAGDIVKSRTQCTEQGPGRWLPKPTDVVATFFALANPDVEMAAVIKAPPYYGGNGCQFQMLCPL